MHPAKLAKHIYTGPPHVADGNPLKRGVRGGGCENVSSGPVCGPHQRNIWGIITIGGRYGGGTNLSGKFVALALCFIWNNALAAIWHGILGKRGVKY